MAFENGSDSHLGPPNPVLAITAATQAILNAEPKEIHDIRTGTFAVGTNNQYFTNLDFVNGMLRDQSMYTWYPLLLTFQDERFTLDQCCALVHRFDYAYSNYLRYSGLQEMGAFAEAITKYLPTATSREEAVEAVKAFLGYLNRLAAWSFHYFPWSIGKHLTYETPEGSKCGVGRPIAPREDRRRSEDSPDLGVAGHPCHRLLGNQGKSRTLQRHSDGYPIHRRSRPRCCQWRIHVRMGPFGQYITNSC
ncbi:hypothetical protein IHE45_08G046000 [Dioscorea alata]|uniref:Uncharacterized protein n=1 Tax=Dioscorea alata TaxID=55571 RepID=A0ACB7VJ17_DIOAL|nr:hypothetical protein IHE45_08G046000 [Dioscorea alata]